jgi:transcriptional regulator with XRE-family HTH domain
MSQASKCSCGGNLKPATLRPVDLAPLFGLHGWFEGGVRGLRCSRCLKETLEGKAYEELLVEVARAVITHERILANDQARFLRKAWLGLTQEQLASRMGINKITVADWERAERPLSKEHDYELRGIALSRLLGQRHAGRGRLDDGIADDMERVLTAPRRLTSARRRGRYVIRKRTA